MKPAIELNLEYMKQNERENQRIEMKRKDFQSGLSRKKAQFVPHFYCSPSLPCNIEFNLIDRLYFSAFQNALSRYCRLKIGEVIQI